MSLFDFFSKKGPKIEIKVEPKKVYQPTPENIFLNQKLKELFPENTTNREIYLLAKRIQSQYNRNNYINDGLVPEHYPSINFTAFAELAFFSTHPIVDTIINVYLHDITSTFPVLQSKEDEKTADILNQEWQKFKCDALITSCVKNDLLFGGCKIVIKRLGELDTTQDIDWNSPQWIGFLDRLEVVEPIYATPSSGIMYYDTLIDRYIPEEWLISYSFLNIAESGVNTAIYHHSHLIHVVTNPAPAIISPTYFYYGISIIHRLIHIVKQLDTLQNDLAKLGLRANLVIYRTIAGDNKIEIASRNINNNSFLPIGVNEEIKGINLPNLDYLITAYNELKKTLLIYAQCTMSRLFGQTESGFTSNDDTGTNNWRDTLDNYQRKFMPFIKRIFFILAKNKGLELPADCQIAWGRDVMTKEKADAMHQEISALTELQYSGIASKEEIRTYVNKHSSLNIDLSGELPKEELNIENETGIENFRKKFEHFEAPKA